mgnify:CR=1 FL=1
MEAKNNMLLGAYYGGIAITGSGTTAVHALSYPLGGKFHIAHGVSNAILFAHVMEFNKDACQDRLAALCDAVYPTYAEKSVEEKADYIISQIADIVKVTNIPTDLTQYGVTMNTNDPEGDNETERFAIANGIPKSEIPVRIPASLGCIIGNMVKRGLNSSMLMTGGDTLLGCIRNLGNAQLTPVGEFEIGIVLSKLISDNNKTHVFTKSGGFGEETLLTDMADKICRRA